MELSTLYRIDRQVMYSHDKIITFITLIDKFGDILKQLTEKHWLRIGYLDGSLLNELKVYTEYLWTVRVVKRRMTRWLPFYLLVYIFCPIPPFSTIFWSKTVICLITGRGNLLQV